MANYWIDIVFFALSVGFGVLSAAFFAKESVMDGVTGICAGVRGIIGALANTLLDNVQGLGLVSILILALLFSNYAPQGEAFEMLANRSMTRAPAIYREICDTNWAGLDGAASRWDATSKSANWADCGEYFSAGLLRMNDRQDATVPSRLPQAHAICHAGRHRPSARNVFCRFVLLKDYCQRRASFKKHHAYDNASESCRAHGNH